MKYLNRAIIFTVIFFIISLSVFAEIDEDIESEFLSDDKGTELKHESSKLRWELSGFLQSDNHFAVPAKVSSDYEVIKLEGRGRLNFKYGTEDYYAKSVMDVFFYPEPYNELNPHDWGRIETQELYFTGGDRLRFKLGKQLFSWGKADLFSVTNYLAQPNRKESFATKAEDKNMGILALSLKYIFGDFSVEGAMTPLHNPVLTPVLDSFWSEDHGSIQSVSVQEVGPDRKTPGMENSSFSIRGGGTIGEVDFHLSYFYGYDNSIVFKPTLIESEPAEIDDYIEMKPYYDRVHKFGFDLAFTLGKLSIRAEGAFTLDMAGVQKIKGDDVTTALVALPDTGEQEITTIDKVPYVEYVIGADYNLWGERGFILLEWMQDIYLKNTYSYRDVRISDILLIRAQDRFLGNRLGVQINGVLILRGDSAAAAPGCEVDWDFNNGMTMTTGGYLFIGMVYLKVKMEF